MDPKLNLSERMSYVSMLQARTSNCCWCKGSTRQNLKVLALSPLTSLTSKRLKTRALTLWNFKLAIQALFDADPDNDGTNETTLFDNGGVLRNLKETPLVPGGAYPNRAKQF